MRLNSNGPLLFKQHWKFHHQAIWPPTLYHHQLRIFQDRPRSATTIHCQHTQIQPPKNYHHPSDRSVTKYQTNPSKFITTLNRPISHNRGETQSHPPIHLDLTQPRFDTNETGSMEQSHDRAHNKQSRSDHIGLTVAVAVAVAVALGMEPNNPPPRTPLTPSSLLASTNPYRQGQGPWPMRGRHRTSLPENYLPRFWEGKP